MVGRDIETKYSRAVAAARRTGRAEGKKTAHTTITHLTQRSQTTKEN